MSELFSIPIGGDESIQYTMSALKVYVARVVSGQQYQVPTQFVHAFSDALDVSKGASK